MRTKLNFANFPGSEALAESIDGKLSGLERAAPHNRLQEAKVQLKVVNSKQHPGADLHECSIELEMGHGARKRLFIRKTKDNMYKAIAAAFDVAKRGVRERLPYRRRKNKKQNV